MNINELAPFNPSQPLIFKAYLEPTDVDMLQEAATNLRNRLLIRLLSRLGCRVTEGLGIALDDIDLVNHTITIQHLKTRIRLSCPSCGSRLSKSHVFCPRCGIKVESTSTKGIEHRRVRTLPIDDVTIGMLKDYIAHGSLVSRQGKMYLFGINRHRAWQIVRNCAVKAQLPRLVNPETGRSHNVSPHKLRDAFAVHAMKVDDSGDGLRLLQEHLGHASFNTTAKYRKVAGEELKEWYQKLWISADS